MRISFILFLLFTCLTSHSQLNKLEISGGFGFSGADNLIYNNVEFDNIIQYNKKKNVLDNKIKNVLSHSGSIRISIPILSKKINGLKAGLTFNEYHYKDVFYKEDKFVIDAINPPYIEDTINTPNWLETSYKLPYIELGISKEIYVNKFLSVEITAFYGIALNFLNHYSTSFRLWNKYYEGWERSTFEFNNSINNDQFDKYNYGVQGSLSLFKTRFIFPKIIFTQGLNDISKSNFILNRHVNLWSLQLVLAHNFDNKLNQNNRKRK
ncbi:MAG TPA: outer membrane beta-barrel protein [Saprospiraceae bacterium]|nr:outer membrane beta-barrel protein [Saprospiraceae bacterium]